MYFHLSGEPGQAWHLQSYLRRASIGTRRRFPAEQNWQHEVKRLYPLLLLHPYMPPPPLVRVDRCKTTASFSFQLSMGSVVYSLSNYFTTPPPPPHTHTPPPSSNLSLSVTDSLSLSVCLSVSLTACVCVCVCVGGWVGGWVVVRACLCLSFVCVCPSVCLSVSVCLSLSLEHRTCD